MSLGAFLDMKGRFIGEMEVVSAFCVLSHSQLATCPRPAVASLLLLIISR
jgi:hypothetical protein